jgi:DNA polymerase-1
MKTLLLIDANSLIHRFFHALPPLTDREGRPAGALYGLAGMLLKILKSPIDNGRPDYIAAAFDRPEKTFREEEFENYKIHRPPLADELVYQLKLAPDLFNLFKIKSFSQAGFEADDIIGTIAEKFKNEKNLQIIILSGDNDVLQLVEDEKIIARIIKTGLSETTTYNESAVEKKYGLKPKQLADYKGFLGDASDNIPGVFGIGPKTATALIKNFGTVENVFDNLAAVDKKFHQKLIGKKDVALLSKRLATIRKDAPVSLNSLKELEALPLDLKALQDYFQKMGFKSLIERLNK